METKTHFFEPGISARLVYLFFLCSILAFGQKYSGDIGQQNPEDYFFEGFSSANNKQDSIIRGLFPFRESKFSKTRNTSAATFYRPLKAVLNGGTRKDYFTYDQSGNLLTSLVENNGNFESRQTFTWDAQGNGLTELYEYFVSGAWKNAELRTFTYDAYGNWTEALIQIWVNDAWVNSDRGTYLYNSSGHLLEVVSSIWTNGAWDHKYRKIITYDQSNLKLTETVETGGNGLWTFYGRSAFTYDQGGNLVEYLTQNWENGAWQNLKRTLRTFDSSGNDLTAEVQDWLNNSWVNSFRSDYTYNSAGKRLSMKSQIWESGNWFNNLFYSYEYNQNGTQTRHIERLWNRGLNDWILQRQFVNEFDVQGNWVLHSNEIWSDSAWFSVEQRERTFDQNNNMLSELRRTRYTGDWKIYYMKDFSYDPHGNCIYGTVVDSVGQPMVDPLQMYYNHGTSAISYSAKTLEIEYQTFTNISDENGSLISFSLSQNYPNPFNPETVIKFALPEAGFVKGIVYDILGREVSTLLNGEMNPGNHEIKFDAVGLSSGVYFFRLTTNRGSNHLKMLLTK
ncbi:MAG: T9SS type A sorting domain-containing protein [Ignavibacteriales bacterium]|nr:T9SS type A sorting domain-containing protein [Ignavibacteriales bacterium]